MSPFAGTIQFSHPVGLEDDGVAWDDLRVTANAMRLPTDNPPTWTDFLGSKVLAFADELVAAEEGVFFTCQMPHAYKEGTNLYPHVHWVPEDNTGGNVNWGLTYTMGNIDAVFPAANTIYVAGTAGSTTNAHRMSSFAAINGSALTISSMLICRLFRNSSDGADTYNGKNAYLLEFDIHYQIDSFGSRAESSK